MNEAEWRTIKDAFEQAIDLSNGERKAFLDSCDTELRGEVEKLIEADAEAEGFIAEPAVVAAGFDDPIDRYIGRQIDSYKIVKEIGRGGMGTVYLATHIDKSFEKTVAIKLIKRGMDTNAVLKRFVMERQILALLQHANIASLLDGGATDDGLPYLVMEYIDGQPITRFCDVNDYGFEQRLELFRKVCDAISYAHRNLVIHRDIKPSNIIVTADGTPKLLDFGIAKLLHPDWSLETNEATATMFRVMTPEYASPEQIRGEPITTASDVYSLGVVLYELLSGKRPFIADETHAPEQIAKIVLTDEPEKPSSVVSRDWAGSNIETDRNKFQPTTREGNSRPKISNPKSLKGDLDNIVLKALRKEPERRYQSVQEFSEDIRRHLAGLPVTATADTTVYRFGKFAMRHRVGVLAAGAILFTLVTATAITAWQATVATRERNHAEQRFNQVRKIANTILFDYHERIKEMPGATEVREKMVNDSLEYLDNLANESDYSLDLQRELALAYRKVGEIQGDGSSAGNLGKTEAALQSYQKALAIQQNLVAANPSNVEDRRLQARLMIDIALQNEASGDLQSRENYARNAITIFTKIAEEQPNETKSRSDLARALWTLAAAVRSKGDLDDAFAIYRQAAEIYERLALEKPEERKFIRNAALTYKNMGGVLELKKDFASATQFYERALIIDMKNAAEEPDSITSQMDLSFSYGSLAAVSINLGDFDSALENGQKRLAVQEKVAAADSKNAFAQASLARTYRQLGDIFNGKGSFNESIDRYQKSITRLEQLLVADPKNAGLSIDLAESSLRLGNCLATSAGKAATLGGKITRFRDALKSQKRSVDIFEGLKAQNMLNKGAEESLANAQKNWQQTGDEIAKLLAK